MARRVHAGPAPRRDGDARRPQGERARYAQEARRLNHTGVPLHLDLATIVAIAAALIAGGVRGFTGFGSALIFMPLATTVFDPKLAAAALLVVDDVLTLPLTVAALRVCRWRTVLPAAIAAMVTSPLGAWLLAHGDAITLRWTICAIVLAMLALILSGVRYHGDPRPEASAGVGAVAGLLGGISQVSGPPVIAFWMSGPFPLAVVRANLLVFFALASFSSFAAYLWYGFFTADALWLMLLVTPAFAAALFAGAWLFRISRGAAYRPLAYLVIAVAAVTSMPIFDDVFR